MGRSLRYSSSCDSESSYFTHTPGRNCFSLSMSASNSPCEMRGSLADTQLRYRSGATLLRSRPTPATASNDGPSLQQHLGHLDAELSQLLFLLRAERALPVGVGVHPGD